MPEPADCQWLTGGVVYTPRAVQDRIRVAANALIVRDGKVLLVEFGGGTDREHFNFPGGGVELGETLEEAVRREVREEACLDVEVERLLLIVESIGSRNTNSIGGEPVERSAVLLPVHAS